MMSICLFTEVGNGLISTGTGDHFSVLFMSDGFVVCTSRLQRTSCVIKVNQTIKLHPSKKISRCMLCVKLFVQKV